MGTHCAHKESHSHNTSHENTQHSHYYPMLISSKYKSELSELYNEFHPPEYQFRRVVAPEWVFYAIHTPQYRRKAAKTVLLHRSKAKRIKAVMSWSHWHWVICSKVPSRTLMLRINYRTYKPRTQCFDGKTLQHIQTCSRQERTIKPNILHE